MSDERTNTRDESLTPINEVPVAPDGGKRLSIIDNPPKDNPETTSETTSENHLRDVTNMFQIGKIEGLSVYSDGTEVDPTEQFFARNSSTLPISPTNIDNLVRDAQLRRILVLSCPDEAVLESIAQGMTRHTALGQFQKRALYLGSAGIGDQGRDYPFGKVHHKIASQRIGNGEKLVLFLFERSGLSSTSSAFLQTLLLHPTQTAQAKELYARKEVILIYLVTQDCVENEVQVAHGGDLNIGFQKIDFLPVRLRAIFPGTDEQVVEQRKEIETKIRMQRKRGLWPMEPRDYDFHIEILGRIKAGDLISDIESRETIKREILPSAFLDPENTVHRHVLFLACYFSRLKVADLLLLTDYLLKAEVSRLSFNRSEGAAAKEISDFTLWARHADDILKACELYVTVEHKGQQVLNFTLGDTRTACLTYFEQHHWGYLHRQFSKLLEGGLLFTPHLPGEILSGIIYLSAKMTVIDPGTYGSKIFFSFIKELDEKIEVRQSKLLEDQIATTSPSKPDDGSEPLATSPSEVNGDNTDSEKKKRKHWLLNRMAWWMREVVRLGGDTGNQKRFLEHLMQDTDHHYLLIELLQLLWDSMGVQSLKWMLRVLKQSNAADRSLYLKAIIDFAKEEPYRIYDVLKEIQTWWPKEDFDDSEFEPFHAQVVLFIFFYSGDEIGRYKNSWGAWPSSFPLFVDWVPDSAETHAQMEFLLDWLMCPFIDYSLAKQLDIRGIELSPSACRPLSERIIAEVLEDWLVILAGAKADGSSADPNGELLATGMIRMLGSSRYRTHTPAIARHWALRPEHYNSEIITCKAKLKDGIRMQKQIKGLAARRDTIRKLLRQLRQQLGSPTQDTHE